MIVKYSVDGEKLAEFETLIQAGKNVGTDAASIYKAVSGKRKICKGFLWKKEKNDFSYHSILRKEGLNPDNVKNIWLKQNDDGEIRYSVNIKGQGGVDEWEGFKKKFFEDLKKYRTPVHKIKYGRQEKTASIINIADAHLDKIVVDGESSFENNVRIFEQAFDDLLQTCVSFRPELIIIPAGNDIFTCNNGDNTTVKGTPQDISVKTEESFIAVVNMYRRCIDKAYKYAKVICPVIRSNHAADKDFYLGEVLKVLYEKNKNVEIQNSVERRRYIQYGQNLLAFAHGDIEVKKIDQLPLLMAEEQKQMWADTTYREWFLGDRHHKFEYKFLRLKDFIGCTVRFLRSISGNDQWHVDQGYVGIPKTAELFIYDKDKGPKANFLVNIK